MTAFRSEADVHLLARGDGRELGALVTPQVLYDLGRDWYATRMDLDWQPATRQRRRRCSRRTDWSESSGRSSRRGANKRIDADKPAM